MTCNSPTFIAIILMNLASRLLQDYASAIDFFNKSNETCGAHHITVRGGHLLASSLYKWHV